MCGICGVLNIHSSKPVEHHELRGMADTMLHRGPDDYGTYISPNRKAGFGFRRLSIVDLSGGHQPMSNEDGTVWIIFNGEIYNHTDLRRELEQSGHRYFTRSDTESIIHAYEQWGEKCVEKLRGMFAFAIWDEKKGKLFLARDRIGIKPLYYTEHDGYFIFASEIKAILAWQGLRREVDMEALYTYLTLLVTPSPLTMFRGIYKIPPGHLLSINGEGAKKIERYWDPVFVDRGLEMTPENEIVERLRDLLTESIRLRLMSDVPLGVFLSGGVDSTLNVALMSKMIDRPVDTFSVAIKDDAISNELNHAGQVAQFFHTNHHEIVITHEDFIKFMPDMVHYQDEPLSDPVCVPLYHVSRLARENGTVVILVGEGSDELFAGYRGYALMLNFFIKYFRPYTILPSWVKSLAAGIGEKTFGPLKADFLRRAAEGEPFFWGGGIAFTELEKRKLLPGIKQHDVTIDVVKGWYDHYQEIYPDAHELDRMIYIELQHRLPELLLMRADKMTMAASVEARVPYLDHELVRFALSIPASLKIRNGQTKTILKKAARGIIPDYVIDRPKGGFCGSARNMVNGKIVDFAQHIISGSKWMKDLFDMNVVKEMFDHQRSGTADCGMKIWLLLNLVLWHNHWIEDRTIDVHR
ncbi:MAG: asparagine synthase (glutamine-hydrolyzing) [Nitrospirota bacterium]